MPLTADIVDRLQSEIPGFNEKPFALADFESLAQKYNIRVLYKKLPCNGLICRIEDVPFIVVNGRLSAGHRAFVGFHELFHYYFHPCGTHFYRSLGRQSWAESQASTVASLALIPTPALTFDIKQGLDLWTIAERYDLPRYVIEYRLKVYQNYQQLRLGL